MAKPDLSTPEGRARKRANDYSGLLWHVATFVVVNTFMWTLDLIGGGGVQWAYWVTIPWGVGLLFHVAAYFIEAGGLEQRKYEQFLAEEQHRVAER